MFISINLGIVLFFFGLDVLADQERTFLKDEKVLFVVYPGESAEEIMDRLSGLGLVKHKWSFRYLTELLGGEEDFKAGKYLLNPQMSLRQIMAALIRGDVATNEVWLTIVEGMTVEDVDQVLASAGLIEPGLLIKQQSRLVNEISGEGRYSWLENDQASLEGFLFPDTYLFEKQDSSDDNLQIAIRKMLNNFQEKIINKVFNKGISSDYEVLPGLRPSFYEIMIMASILEKEVKTEEEKYIAAGILWKRLQEGMRLQVDSTVNYVTGKNLPGITLEDTQIDSEYNTYKKQGLPPTPIDNPGITSIRAALNPQPSEYWFYLSTPDGKTLFSKTYEDHLFKKHLYLE